MRRVEITPAGYPESLVFAFPDSVPDLEVDAFAARACQAFEAFACAMRARLHELVASAGERATIAELRSAYRREWDAGVAELIDDLAASAEAFGIAVDGAAIEAVPASAGALH